MTDASLPRREDFPSQGWHRISYPCFFKRQSGQRLPKKLSIRLCILSVLAGHSGEPENSETETGSRRFAPFPVLSKICFPSVPYSDVNEPKDRVLGSPAGLSTRERLSETRSRVKHLMNDFFGFLRCSQRFHRPVCKDVNGSQNVVPVAEGTPSKAFLPVQARVLKHLSAQGFNPAETGRNHFVPDRLFWIDVLDKIDGH